MKWISIAMVLACGSVARAQQSVPYPWRAGAVIDTVGTRFPTPPGARRSVMAGRSFGAWLRGLPLLAAGTPVKLFDGRHKPRQDVHAAVADLDVGTRDLQQCADAVMRLRAEYLYATGHNVRFHPDPAHQDKMLMWNGGDRNQWWRFLVKLFSEAGSASLQAELPTVRGIVQPGDVLIQGGYPGHAVLVLDAADGADGKRYVLLGQSYMPAQQFHVVVNPLEPEISPWYDASALDSPLGLKTPEWKPFTHRDLHRFVD